MKSIEELIARLKEVQRLANPGDHQVFHNIVTELEATGNPQILRPLLEAFSDDVEDYDVFWTALHAAESFGVPTYGPVLLEVLPTLVTNAWRWAETLLAGILTNGAS
jgi:HEAT repeat protein